jgi:hypothetical protein
MKPADALATLASMRPEAATIESELGQRGHTVHLRVSRVGSPERWAVVWTPGDVWFSLEVEGGYALDHLEGEDTPDDDVRRILAELIEIAVQYVLSDTTPGKTRFLSFPTMTLATPHGEVVFRRSLVHNLKSMFRRQRAHTGA